MHRIHYKVNNITSGLSRQLLQFTNTTQNTVIKVTITSKQPIFPLEEKAINVTGPVIRAKIPPYLKKYPPKTFSRKLKDHLISKQQGTITT